MHIPRPCSGILGCLLVIACGQPEAPKPPEARSLVSVPASSTLHLRASFDSNPSTYLGTFLPEGLPPSELSDRSGVASQCSEYMKPRTQAANQEQDEFLSVSKSAAASLGLPMAAGLSVGAGHDDTVTLRVHYKITEKMQVEVDANGLARCCKADATQCKSKVVGEFLRGSGEIYAAYADQNGGRAGVATPQVGASIDYKSSLNWTSLSKFNDTYFAFTTRTVRDKGEDGKDCAWCDNLPGSVDGKYFCGVSDRAPSEVAARDLAMNHARQQVVRFMGETLETSSSSQRSTAKGLIDDAQFMRAAAAGVAASVKDEKWCPAVEKLTTDGPRFQSRVLAYVPNAAIAHAAVDAIQSVIEARKKEGRLNAEQEKALNDLATTFKK